MKFGTLQVFPRQGVLKEHGLELPTAVIGRGEGAGILIDDFSVSRRHARLTVESSKLLVEDLGSVSGTFVNGERLEPGIRHLVEAGAVLKFGEIEARFVPPGAAEPLAAGGVAQPLEDATFGVSGLSVALAAPGQPIEPGRSADATVVVVNRGRLVDHVRLEIPDLPADWYTIDTPAFPVLPGGRANVKVTLHPPRRHDAAAGIYEFTVRVRTQEYDEHAEVPGSLEVLPFESATLEFEAMRSKKRFRLVAENSGNHLARYELSGRDEEQAFKYEFETPAVELQPGEKRILDLTVRRKRRLFGFPTQPPFEVVGRNETGGEITARGQLSINPPLQRFKMPVAMALIVALLAATALAVFIIADEDGTQTASAEDPYAGVHLCEDKDAKAEQEKRNADAANDKPLAGATVVGPYDGGSPIFGQVDSTGAPFFAQSDPRWGGEEYARSSELPNGKDWCGTTIEQCGCAMTSVSVMLALYDLVQMPGGEALSPQSLNNWFNGAARQTDRGWVSRGYIYGDVIWSAANELSGEIAKVNPSARTVRFVRTGSGSVEEIRADLEAGRPVIVEVPGHWIAAVGLDGDEILINDPFYRDRKTLSAYAGKVRSSVHYEPSSDLSSVVITAPADVKFKITDKQGRVVNTGQGTLDQPTDQLNQIPGASLSQKHAWRDPTCIESAPPPDAGTNQVVLPGSRDDYTIEIIGTSGQAGSVAIHTYGKDGTSSIATIEGVEGTKADLQFDPNAEKPVITIQNNGGGTTPASTPTPNAAGAGGGDDETPTSSPTPLPPPTATQTPFIEQRTAMTLPAEAGQTRVEVATNSGFELGDPIRFAPGLPNQEDNLIVGFGSFILATPLQFSHGPGEPILRLQRPPGQGPGLPPGVTPPPSTGPLLPPEQVTMACSTIYQASPKLATFICDVQVVGDFTTTRWTINGQVVTEFSGSTSFVMSFPGDTPASISATVCNVTLCRSTSRNENVQFPPGGSGTSSGGTSGGVTGAGSGAAPTPPPGGAVTVTCGTEFDQNVRPTLAIIDCQANFGGAFTSVSWSAPGGTPASANGPSKTFETKLPKDRIQAASLKVTATVCNFGTCRTSQPFTVGIATTVTSLDTSPQTAVNQRGTVTLFAAVVGLNGIVPQGGSVQFYVGDAKPLGASAQLFTVGSTSVAQTTVNTSAGALFDIALYEIYAEYSGGINAFGSVSPKRNFQVLEPIPDGCDSVNEDANGDTDETCNFATPKDLGGGTILQSVTITGGTSDGLPNAVKAAPGETLTVNGVVTRSEYCPGCLRQVYVGIGGYDSSSPPTAIGPQCGFSDSLFSVPSRSMAQLTFQAPTAPGVYYLRATTTLNYVCMATPVGPPSHSVGRIVVEDEVVASIDTFANDATPTNPWDDVIVSNTPGSNTPVVTSTESGATLVLRARVPVGAAGFVDFAGLRNDAGDPLVASAPICPPAPGNTVPSGANKGHACVPGEARIVSPVFPDNRPSVNLTAKFSNDQPLRLVDPFFGFQTPQVIDYPVYRAPTVGSGFTPDPYPVKILIDSAVTVTSSPDPAQMGQQFTLRAVVGPASAPTGGSVTAVGGTVQFEVDTGTGGAPVWRPIGAPQPVVVDGTADVATISWVPWNCNPGLFGENCPGLHYGFPFDAQDQKPGAPNLYDAVRAVFVSGTSDLKGGTSNTIDVDIEPASSTTTHTTSIPGGGTIGDSFTMTAIVTTTGFSPAGGVVSFRADGTEIASTAIEDDDCAPLAPLANYTGDFVCTVASGQITSGTGAIADAGTYGMNAVFSGTGSNGLGQVAGSPSAVFDLNFSREVPTLRVQMPGSRDVETSAEIRAELDAAARDSVLGQSPARVLFRHNGVTLPGGDRPVENLGGTGVYGATFNVQNLPAGTYTLTVEYTGNASFAPRDCTPVVGEATAPDCPRTLTQVINKVTPTVTLNNVPETAIGANLTLSASVSGGSGLLSPAGGSVSFYVGSVTGTPLATDISIDNGNVSVSVPTGDGSAFLTACQTLGENATGPNDCPAIVAHFNGDETGDDNLNAATSSADTLDLDKRDSTATTPSGSGQRGATGTMIVTVAASGAPDNPVAPTCADCIRFQVDTDSGSGETWADIPDLSSDVAHNVPADGEIQITFAIPAPGGLFATTGNHRVRAVYSGNDNLNTRTSGVGTFTVTLFQPTVTLNVPSAPVLIGATFNLSADVSGAGVNSPNGGTVTFRSGTTVLGTSSVVSGTATLSNIATGASPFSTAATYTQVTARFNGDASLGNSEAVTSAAGSVTVSKMTPTLTVTLPSGGTVGVGTNAVIRAVISGAVVSQLNDDGARLFFRNNGGAIIGGTQDVVDLGGGVWGADFNVQNLNAGTFEISVEYEGNRYYLSSTSAEQTLTITPAVTTISLSVSVDGSNRLDMTATVNSTFGGSAAIDGGMIAFYLDGSTTAFATGPASNGVVNSNNHTIPAGNHTVTAKFLGWTNWDASPLSSSQPFTIP